MRIKLRRKLSFERLEILFHFWQIVSLAVATVQYPDVYHEFFDYIAIIVGLDASRFLKKLDIDLNSTVGWLVCCFMMADFFYMFVMVTPYMGADRNTSEAGSIVVKWMLLFTYFFYLPFCRMAMEVALCMEPVQCSWAEDRGVSWVQQLVAFSSFGILSIGFPWMCQRLIQKNTPEVAFFDHTGMPVENLESRHREALALDRFPYRILYHGYRRVWTNLKVIVLLAKFSVLLPVIFTRYQAQAILEAETDLDGTVQYGARDEADQWLFYGLLFLFVALVVLLAQVIRWFRRTTNIFWSQFTAITAFYCIIMLFFTCLLGMVLHFLRKNENDEEAFSTVATNSELSAATEFIEGVSGTTPHSGARESETFDDATVGVIIGEESSDVHAVGIALVIMHMLSCSFLITAVCLDVSWVPPHKSGEVVSCDELRAPSIPSFEDNGQECTTVDPSDGNRLSLPLPTVLHGSARSSRSGWMDDSAQPSSRSGKSTPIRATPRVGRGGGIYFQRPSAGPSPATSARSSAKSPSHGPAIPADERPSAEGGLRFPGSVVSNGVPHTANVLINADADVDAEQRKVPRIEVALRSRRPVPAVEVESNKPSHEHHSKHHTHLLLSETENLTTESMLFTGGRSGRLSVGQTARDIDDTSGTGKKTGDSAIPDNETSKDAAGNNPFLVHNRSLAEHVFTPTTKKDHAPPTVSPLMLKHLLGPHAQHKTRTHSARPVTRNE